MAFLSGIQVIHAPASALNNAGSEAGVQTENKVAVKKLRIGRQVYPYISAQAWRYWLRTTLLQHPDWKASPLFREAKIAYTEANPIQYADDDIFGYMRAPSKKAGAAEGLQPLPIQGVDALTRVAPLRIGTLVSLTPGVVSDFGTMSRHEGDPVPHEHEFYAAALRGLFGLDLGRVGVFTTSERTGFENLDELRKQAAIQAGATTPDGGKTYILPEATRWTRIKALLEAFPLIEGGAKQTLHATDVTPVIVVMAVFQGGVNPFYPIIHPDEQGAATIHTSALVELVKAWKDYILSPLYIGWVEGYPPFPSKTPPGQLKTQIEEQLRGQIPLTWGHPREVFKQLVTDLEKNPEWWEPILPFHSAQ